MTPDVLLIIAVTASVGAVFVIVTPDRLPQGAEEPRRSRPGLSVPGWLTAAAGAPSVGVRVLLGAAVGLVLMVTGVLSGVLGGVMAALAGVGVFVAAGRVGSPGEPSARVELASALPVICTQLAVCMEAGLPLRNAVAVLGDCLGGEPARVLRRLDAAVRLGVPEEQAWAELGEDHPELGGLARELRHAASGGAALAAALRQQAAEARATNRSAAESRARRAGVSIVLPLGVCFLPAFLLVGVVPVVGGVLSRLFG